jgi:D-3-phosphoglycerate dehydrogenase
MNEPVIKAAPNAFCRDDILRSELLARFPNAVFNDSGQRLAGPTLIDFLKDADGAVIGLEEINDDILAACPNLKIVAKFGVGLNNLDQDAMTNHGVRLGWTSGVNRRSVSEMTLGFMLGLTHNLYISDRQMRAGTWHRDGGRQLSQCTVGIVGFGNIGRDLAALLKPLGCRMLINDVLPLSDDIREAGGESVDFDTLIRESDIVTVHTPLTKQTRGMICKPVLKAMKEDAIFINTARGEIVVEEDLKTALKEGWIGAAAMDVYNVEPVTDRELLDLPNTAFTPHIGGNTREAVLAMGQSAISHLQDYFRQE